jgi:hypothetical protein
MKTRFAGLLLTGLLAVSCITGADNSASPPLP